jgi:extradiol dioxygenase family protein
VLDALQTCVDQGLRLALCSSSDDRIIDAVVDTLGLASRFELTHSAEHDEFGKPHPQPYLTTAAKLGVVPARCLALEDSIAGCLSAKSAGMTVIAVPDASARPSPRFAVADLVLPSLTHLDHTALTMLDRGVPAPNLGSPRFHLAFPVNDLEAARRFYGGILGCPEGRSSDTWVDFDLWGHQIVAHLSTDHESPSTNDVDGHEVPSSHFGLLLHASAWHELVERLQVNGVPFIIEPTLRFAGLAGEQRTCFVSDPAGNALEFKAFTDDRQVFARD